MANEMIIRLANEKDVEDIFEIEKEAFITPWSKKALKIELSENSLAKYTVIEYDGKVVAYGGMWIILNEAHVTNIAVRKNYRGLGLGNKIIESLIYLCDIYKLDTITLEVRKSNEVAKNLYFKYGFYSEGMRKKYYRDNNEDAIIMRRNNKEVREA